MPGRDLGDRGGQDFEVVGGGVNPGIPASRLAHDPARKKPRRTGVRLRFARWGSTANTDRLVGFPVVVGGEDGEYWPWPGAENPNPSSLACCRSGQPADRG
jgi:hypothetical protein